MPRRGEPSLRGPGSVRYGYLCGGETSILGRLNMWEFPRDQNAKAFPVWGHFVSITTVWRWHSMVVMENGTRGCLTGSTGAEKNLRQGIGDNYFAVSGMLLRISDPVPRTWIWERGNTAGQFPRLGEEEERYQCGDARDLSIVSL